MNNTEHSEKANITVEVTGEIAAVTISGCPCGKYAAIKALICALIMQEDTKAMFKDIIDDLAAEEIRKQTLLKSAKSNNPN